MSQTLREALSTKTKEELLEMYINLVDNTQNVYYELAITDPLTQVYNRRGAEAYFNKLLKNNELENKKLVFVDLNHFKHINDDLGHDWGDRALFVIAQRMKSYFKNSIITRFGGDEFLVITDAPEYAIREFDRVVNSEPVEYDGNKLNVHCGVGYAKYEKGLTLRDWIMLADKEMLIDKHKQNIM